MQEPNDHGRSCTYTDRSCQHTSCFVRLQGVSHKTIRQRPVDAGSKQSLGPDERILHTSRIVALELLSSPLTCWIHLFPANIIKFGVQDPTHHRVVDR